MRHFKIEITVAYDDSFPVPFDIQDDLRANITRCVETENLINDVQGLSVVDDWNINVQETTRG